MANTPYSRISFVYSKHSIGASEEVGTTHLTSNRDGFTWKLFSNHIRHDGSILDMRKWSQASNNAIDTFTDSLKTLAPGDIFEEFCRSKITDTKALEAPHRQQENGWLQPLQQRLFLYRTGQGREAAEEWLGAEQEALKTLLTILCLGGGISFRLWQYSTIQWDSSGSSERNIWILNNGTAIIARPLAKQRDRTHAPTLLAFPHRIHREIQFYLYVVRPTICRILEQLGLDTSRHHIFLWVHFSPPFTGRQALQGHNVPDTWNSSKLSAVVKAYTAENLGITLSPLIVRQCEQAIFREKVPQLFSKMTHSNSDRRMLECSQHFGFPTRWADMGSVGCVQLLAVCQIWQSILSIEPIEGYWLSLVDGLSIFTTDCEKHWSLALATAYRLLSEEQLPLVRESQPIPVRTFHK